jgi:hypothetical protein
MIDAMRDLTVDELESVSGGGLGAFFHKVVKIFTGNSQHAPSGCPDDSSDWADHPQHGWVCA